MSRRTTLATGVALALLAGSACSDDDPPPSADRPATTTTASTSTTTASTTTTSAPEDGYVKARPDPELPRQDIDINLRYPASFSAEQLEVVQAWANYRHVFYVTADPPDPDSELLSQYASAQVAANARQQRRDFATQGLVVRIPDDGVFRETVVAVVINGEAAQLRTCEVDSAQIIESASGDVRDDRVITKAIDVELVRVDGSWRAAPGSEDERWPGNEEARCIDS